MHKVLSRIAGKSRRTLAKQLCRRMIVVNPPVPIVSFTFDDAPRTAFTTGLDILSSHGAKATFFVSLGLLGSHTEVGAIALAEDLAHAATTGNEVGCHTFDHLDAWETSTATFIQSVARNQQALEQVVPGTRFKTFAYPKNGATVYTKFRLGKHFTCCRGGGQAPNIGAADLNLLKACFLDRRTKIDMNFVRQLVDVNAARRGWLIFATHDVCENPSEYGCTTAFFREVVSYAAGSGAVLLPLAEACRKVEAGA